MDTMSEPVLLFEGAAMHVTREHVYKAQHSSGFGPFTTAPSPDLPKNADP